MRISDWSSDVCSSDLSKTDPASNGVRHHSTRDALPPSGTGGGGAGGVSYDRLTMAKAQILTSQADDFPRWYQDVVAKAEMAETGQARGPMVIRPYGYGLGERMAVQFE